MSILNKIINLLPILFFSLFFTTKGITQDDIYYAHNATLQVNGEYENKLLRGQTKDLLVILDYETTEMFIKFYLNDLVFNTDTLNNLFKSKPLEIIFNGELSLDFINTNGHPPLDFIMEGWLTAGKLKTKLAGKGELHHLDNSGTYACILGMTINLNLKDLGMDVPAGLNEELEVVIIQALLEKDKN